MLVSSVAVESTTGLASYALPVGPVQLWPYRFCVFP